MTDVIVTVEGRSRQTIEAIRAGGGLLGIRSNVGSRPRSGIEFVDWPFLEDLRRDAGFPVEQHVEVVAAVRPRYAVAPDVQPPRDVDDVVQVADRLDQYAETVIIAPKTVPPSAIPDRFRVGVPFRNEFSTRLFTNTYDDFRGEGPVHILGGNPNGQLLLADQFDLWAGSVDTPKILAWADGGRVFVGAGGGGVEIRQLNQDIQNAIRDRGDRIRFSVENMVEAWNEGQITYRFTERVDVGQGPPPVPDEPGLLGPAETFEEKERMAERRERFETAFAFKGTLEEDVRTFAFEQTTLGDVPDAIVDEGVTITDRSQQAALEDFLNGPNR